MKQIPKELCKGQLSNSTGTLYTAPSDASTGGQDQKAIVKEIWIANTDSADLTYTIYVVESGGSAAANRAILSAISIPANTTHLMTDLSLVMESGATIRGVASSASKVSYRISGEELL